MKLRDKYYPIYIALLGGIPTFTLTYWVIDKKNHDVFWFLMLIYVIIVLIQQIKWNRSN